MTRAVLLCAFNLLIGLLVEYLSINSFPTSVFLESDLSDPGANELILGRSHRSHRCDSNSLGADNILNNRCNGKNKTLQFPEWPVGHKGQPVKGWEQCCRQ